MTSRHPRRSARMRSRTSIVSGAVFTAILSAQRDRERGDQNGRARQRKDVALPPRSAPHDDLIAGAKIRGEARVTLPLRHVPLLPLAHDEHLAAVALLGD